MTKTVCDHNRLIDGPCPECDTEIGKKCPECGVEFAALSYNEAKQLLHIMADIDLRNEVAKLKKQKKKMQWLARESVTEWEHFGFGPTYEIFNHDGSSKYRARACPGCFRIDHEGDCRR